MYENINENMSLSLPLSFDMYYMEQQKTHPHAILYETTQTKHTHTRP